MWLPKGRDQSDAAISETDIRQQLTFVNRCSCLDGFQFNDDTFFNDHVGEVGSRQPEALKNQRQRHIPPYRKTS